MSGSPKPSARLAPPSAHRAPGVTFRLFVLGSLYLSQGLPYGFFVQALPVLLRKQGLSLGAIGLSSMLAIPWGLKFLWSPAVDRYSSLRFGHRKSWIIPAQLLSIAALAALAFVSLSRSLALVLALVFLSNAMTATQDIATDGLSLDVMARGERGLANGVKVSAYRGGMILGGGALLGVYDRIGWSGSYLWMGAMIAAASLPLFLLREPQGDRSARELVHPFEFFTRQGAPRIVIVLVTYKLGDAFSTAMLRTFFADMGLSLAEIGWLIGTVGFVAGLLGAFAGGALVNRVGRRRALLFFGVLQAISVGGYAYIALTHPPSAHLPFLVAFEHFASSMSTATLFTCMMDWTSKETSATDFSVQASVVVLATLGASGASGAIAEKLGYGGHFVFSTAAAIASVLIVLALFPDEAAFAASNPRRRMANSGDA